MKNMLLTNKTTLDKSEISSKHIVLNGATIIQTQLYKDDVESFHKDGNNLILKLKNGDIVVIENFFIVYEDKTSDLVFEGNECAFLWFDWNNGAILFKEITGLEMLLAPSSVVGASYWAWAGGAAVVVGGIAAAAGGGGRDSDHSSAPSVVPNAPIVKIDTIGPNLSGNTTLSGTVDKKNADVHITVGLDANGQPITYPAIVDQTPNANGTYNWTVKVPTSSLPPVGSDVIATGTITDVQTGLTSGPSIDKAPIQGAPAAPVVTIDPIIPTGTETTLSGTVDKPNATVTVDVGGTTYPVVIDPTANPNGTYNWTVDVPTASLPPAGQPVEVEATVKDPNTGLVSDPSTDTELVPSIPIIIAAPTVTITTDKNNDGYLNAAELKGLTQVDVLIQVPAGAQVGDRLIIEVNGTPLSTVVITAEILKDGHPIKVTPPTEGAQLIVEAAIQDTAGNVSTKGSDRAVIDTTSTAAPTVTITTDKNNDGYLNTAELLKAPKDQVDVLIKVQGDAKVGDILKITEIGKTSFDVTITETIMKNGYTLTADRPAAGKSVQVEAVIVDQAGNISSTGVDSVVLTVPLLIGPELTQDIHNSGTTLHGGMGDDILLGDDGGVNHLVLPTQNYNIAIVVDTSGSMAWNLNGKETSNTAEQRITLVKEALIQYAKILSTYTGKINLTIIDFAGNDKVNQTHLSIENFSKENLTTVNTEINSWSANGGTNYEAAFNKVAEWFNSTKIKAATTEQDYENITYFLTDGDPTFYLNNQGKQEGSGSNTSDTELTESLQGFKNLEKISKVHAVGIGQGVSYNNLKLFDNTNITNDVHTFYKTVVFETFTKSSSVNSWHTGSSTLKLDNGRLSFVVGASKENVLSSDSFVTSSGATKLSLELTTTQIDQNDTFSITLEKLVNGSWVRDGQSQVYTSKGTTNLTNVVYTFDVESSATYRWKVIATDMTHKSLKPFTILLDNISYATPVGSTAIGEPLILTQASEFKDQLNPAGLVYDGLKQVGHDTIDGGTGDDIIFGDVINTDHLSVQVSSLPVGSGVYGLKTYLKDQVYKREPTDQEIYDYILKNHQSLNKAGDLRGGNDIIHGGAGNDTIYGQGGDDRIEGGAGNDIISTGTGNDTIIFNLLDTIDVTGGNGTDTWIDYEANDKIEFGEDFFVGLLADHSNLDKYLTVTSENGHAVVKVDRTGSTSTTDKVWNDLLIIENKAGLTLDELLLKSQIVIV